MPDKPTVKLTPAETFALSPGEARAIEAKASQDDATFLWVLKNRQVSTGSAVTVHGNDEEIGIYTVTATVGSETSEPATVEVTLAAPEEPAVWHETFAIYTAVAVGALVAVLSIPAYLVAWRAAFGKDTASQVVAMFLVLPGLLALGVGSYLLLLDYRGRTVDAPAPRKVRRSRNALNPGEIIEAIGTTIGNFSKATRGAAVLVLAAVAIFGFAAWAAVGGDPADPSKTPSPGASTSSDPSPSPTPPSSPAPAPASPEATPTR